MIKVISLEGYNKISNTKQVAGIITTSIYVLECGALRM